MPRADLISATLGSFEQAVYHYLQDKRYIVLRSGWPDFLVVDRGRRAVMTLECKGFYDHLSEGQFYVLRALQSAGVNAQVLRQGSCQGLGDMQRAIEAMWDQPHRGQWATRRDRQFWFILRDRVCQFCYHWNPPPNKTREDAAA